MKRLLAPCAFALVSALAPDARALTQLQTTAAACTGFIIPSIECEFLAPSEGPGATSSIQRGQAEPGGTSGRSASATVTDFDHFSASAEAGIDYTLSPPAAYVGQLVQRRGVAFARFRDSLTASGATGSGMIRLQWQIDGVNSFVNDSINPQIIDILNEVMLVMNCSSGPMSSLSQDCGSGSVSFDNSGPAQVLATFDLPMVFGAPVFFLVEFQLHAITGFGSTSCDDPCIVDFHGDVDADFSSTGTLVDVQLFDGFGNELDPSGIQAESLFRYDLVGQNVPEPSLAALVALFVLSHTRRKRS